MKSGSGSLIVLLALLISSGAFAQCIDYSEYLHWQGGTVLGAETDYHGCAASETRAAVLLREFQYDMQWHFFVQPVDVSDPSVLQLGERLEIFGRSEDIDVVGEHAYIVYGNLLDIIDISDLDTPHLVGHGMIPDDANGVDLSENLAYVAYGQGYPYFGGLSVVDVSNPSMPATIGDCTLPHIAHDVAVAGDIAVVLVDDSMLFTVDISNPNDPQQMGSLDTLGGTFALAVVGSHAFVAAAAAGLQVVDIGDPYNPELVAELPLMNDALHIRADEGHAYVACGYAGLQIVDISDPSYPVLESTVRYARPSFSVGLWENHLYYTSDFALVSCDVSSCAYPPLVGNEEAPGTPSYLATAGDYLFATGGDFQVYDIADPENPQYVASENLASPAYAMALDGDYAYAAVSIYGLQIIDVSNPLDPVSVGGVQANYCRAVDVEWPLACILLGDLGDNFFTVDVTDASDPQILGSLELDGTIEWVQMDGSVAYATSNGFHSIDISDPENPQVLDMLDFYTLNCFAISGSYAYVPVLEHLELFSIDHLYIIDISDPADLQIVGTVRIPSAYAVSVAEPFVYLASVEAGISVYDVNDPTQPVLVGAAYTYDGVRSVLVQDPYVYAGGYVYLGGQDYYTLHVASVQCLPTGLPEMDWRPGPSRLTSFPNPSRGESSVRFELAERDRVVIGIYSVDGRLQRRLMDAPLEAGAHDLTWDGRDEGGHPVAAGIYLARIETSLETHTSRFVILR